MPSWNHQSSVLPPLGNNAIFKVNKLNWMHMRVRVRGKKDRRDETQAGSNDSQAQLTDDQFIIKMALI